MEVIEDRHSLRSTLVASQLPADLWHDLHWGSNPRRHSGATDPQRLPTLATG